MLVWLILYTISENVVRSTPIPSTSPDDYITTLEFVKSRIQSRTLWDIVWACLTTTLACTWLSVHPNVPAPGDGWWIQFWRRSKAMIWALIAPELVICWALRQWFGARRNRDEINRFLGNSKAKKHIEKWSSTHGHFLQMGGFMLYEKLKDGTDIAIATISSRDELLALVREKIVDFPVITKKEIKDRSKGDAISKSFTTFQTTWFVIQCITRGVRHLAITKLEIVTLALAALNAIMCFLWWSKPLDVGVPVRVYCLTSPTSRSNNSVEDSKRHSILARALIALQVLILNPISDLLGSFETAIPKGNASDEMNAEENASMEKTSVSEAEPAVEIPDSDIVEYVLSKKQLRVTDFHASDRLSDGKGAFVFLVGSLFGGIHCTGWNTAFPSHTEAILWHASSITIISIPLFGIPIATRDKTIKWLDSLRADDNRISSYLAFTCIAFYMVFMSICLFLYIGARLFLFVEAVISLRDLPQSAYTTVRWTQFLPHV